MSQRVQAACHITYPLPWALILPPNPHKPLLTSGLQASGSPEVPGAAQAGWAPYGQRIPVKIPHHPTKGTVAPLSSHGPMAHWSSTHGAPAAA